MTSIYTDCPLQPLIDHNRCGQNSCPSNVKRGMQCHTCKAWWHFKCTDCTRIIVEFYYSNKQFGK
ncbi:hypothetical protein T265_08718 [Opisthorchis viverrini]|uniref:Uncharacterized protein n=1 Tax=Opisthorchis viverrini TaxID=6198 RepID=A0A075A7F9_OPIVI|nr:hypothetical protein T265_08718 [Opisthorchis viverrini]KER23394.1 hypothetical protein T265_08718 [Opisthorchis viverrini]